MYYEYKNNYQKNKRWFWDKDKKDKITHILKHTLICHLLKYQQTSWKIIKYANELRYF